jgi:GNAT superfamily N-acetyltransferase
MNEDLARAYAMAARFDERLCTRREAFPFGTAYFDERHRDRYVSNFLRADTHLDDATPQALMAAADELLGAAGYEHRTVLVRDESVGEAMAPAFTEAGYRAETIVLMALRRQPDRGPTVDVEEVSFERARPVIHETYRRDERLEGVVEQFTDQHGHYERAVGARFFLGSVDGEPAGVCELWTDGPDALVEHVDTLEEFRNRGVARSVVLGAVQTAKDAGAERIFIAADDNDWPKQLYGRLGFDRLGREWEFIRWPSPS